MSRVRRRFRAKGALVAVGIAIIALSATAVVASSPASTKKSAASGAAALAALNRTVRGGLLSTTRILSVRRSAGPVGAPTPATTANWSGYADQAAGTTFTKVSGSWTQPAVTCPTNEDEFVVFWVGLDGLNGSTVEQDGTLAQCYQGSASYYTWWEMFPTNGVQVVGGTVAPGDHIAASVNFSAGQYALKVTDSTHTANSFSEKEKCATGLTCANASAEWIAETPDFSRGYSPWPNFATWKTTADKVTGSGTAGVVSTFPGYQLTIVGSDGENLDSTGNLNGAGNAFNAVWAYTW